STFAPHQRADLRLNGGVQKRGRAGTRDRGNERSALADPKQTKGAVVDASTTAWRHTQNVPYGLVGFGMARDLATVLGQYSRGGSEKALLDRVALSTMLEVQLDRRG